MKFYTQNLVVGKISEIPSWKLENMVTVINNNINIAFFS